MIKKANATVVQMNTETGKVFNKNRFNTFESFEIDIIFVAQIWSIARILHIYLELRFR